MQNRAMTVLVNMVNGTNMADFIKPRFLASIAHESAKIMKAVALMMSTCGEGLISILNRRICTNRAEV